MAALILISISTPPDISAKPLRAAIVPFENRTGYTRLDYLSDLSFNLIVSFLAEYEGIDLFERQRTDLIVREKGLSSDPEGEPKIAIPVDLILSGAFRMGDENEKKIQLQVRWLNSPDTGEVISERDLPSIAIQGLLSRLEDMLREAIIGPNKLRKKNSGYEEEEISGRSVAVIGFNNYSSLKEYDSLQKGIIYLMEERLSREPDLKVVDRDQLKTILSEHELTALSGDSGINFNFIPADLLVEGCYTFSDGEFIIYSRIINIHTTQIERAFSYESNPDQILNTSIEIIEDIARVLSRSRKKGEAARDIYPPSKEAFFYYARGADLYSRGEYAEAIAYINRALTVNPEYVFGQWEVARIYEEYLGRYHKALEAYKKVLEQPCGETIREKALLRLAMINYHHLENYPGAVEYFTKFQEEFPDSVFSDIILYSLGHSYQRMGKYEKALKYYQRGMEGSSFSPLRGSFLVRIGQCHYLSGDQTKARKNLEKAIDCCGTAIFQSEKNRKEITVKEEATRYITQLK